MWVSEQQFYRTIQPIYQILLYLSEELNLMATQAEVDAITTELGQVSNDLVSAQTTLQAEIDQLASANPSVDVTALKAAADALDPAVVKLAGLVPDPPAAPAAPAS